MREEKNTSTQELKNGFLDRNQLTKSQKVESRVEEHHRTDRWHTRPHLFPGRHGRNHIRKVSPDAILRSACKKLEIEGVSTHSFRRTALTRMMSNAGVPLRHIQGISGHRTLSALERYLGVTK